MVAADAQGGHRSALVDCLVRTGFRTSGCGGNFRGISSGIGLDALAVAACRSGADAIELGAGNTQVARIYPFLFQAELRTILSGGTRRSHACAFHAQSNRRVRRAYFALGIAA